jgi:hypothetical protein
VAPADIAVSYRRCCTNLENAPIRESAWRYNVESSRSPSAKDEAMPVHDWTRVNAGLFHHYHQRWISAICDHFNAGNLPAGYYALSGQVAGGPVPDVLTLEHRALPKKPMANGGLAVATAPPRTRFIGRTEMDLYAQRADRVAIRHPLGQVVALLEIVSPGNKNSAAALRAFVEKTIGFLRQGIHVLIVDLFAPSK